MTLVILSFYLVFKIWDCFVYCNILHISRRATHCVVCDERQCVIDAHSASTHLLCSSGGVLRAAQPLLEVLGCGKLLLGHSVETAVPQHYIISCPFSPTTSNGSQERPAYRKGQASTRPGCPESRSSSIHVVPHLWTVNYSQWMWRLKILRQGAFNWLLNVSCWFAK